MNGVPKWLFDLVDPSTYRMHSGKRCTSARIEGLSCLGACVRVDPLLSSALVDQVRCTLYLYVGLATLYTE